MFLSGDRWRTGNDAPCRAIVCRSRILDAPRWDLQRRPVPGLRVANPEPEPEPEPSIENVEG